MFKDNHYCYQLVHVSMTLPEFSIKKNKSKLVDTIPDLQFEIKTLKI